MLRVHGGLQFQPPCLCATSTVYSNVSVDLKAVGIVGILGRGLLLYWKGRRCLLKLLPRQSPVCLFLFFVFLQYRKFWSFNWWVPLHSKFIHLLQTSCLLSLLPSSPVLYPSASAVRCKPGSPQSDDPRRARGKDITYLALKTKKPLPQRWQENFGRMFVCQASVSSPNTDYTTTP